jgi:hypothetical protein
MMDCCVDTAPNGDVAFFGKMGIRVSADAQPEK